MARRSRVRPLPPNSNPDMKMIKINRWKGVLPDKPMSGRWCQGGDHHDMGMDQNLCLVMKPAPILVFFWYQGDHFHRESRCPAACRRGARTQKVGGVAHCCSGCQALQRDQNQWRLRRVLFRCRLVYYLLGWGWVGGWVGAITSLHLRCISSIVDATSQELL